MPSYQEGVIILRKKYQKWPVFLLIKHFSDLQYIFKFQENKAKMKAQEREHSFGTRLP